MHVGATAHNHSKAGTRVKKERRKKKQPLEQVGTYNFNHRGKIMAAVTLTE